MDDKTEAVGTAVAATLGVAVGGPLGAIVGAAATPYLVSLTERAWGEMVAGRRRSVANLIGSAANRMNLDAEQMVAGALEDERKNQHLNDAMAAAAQTVSAEKVEQLACALAAGLIDDGARLDEANLILRALSELEPIHVRTLRDVRGATSERPYEPTTGPWAVSVMGTLQRLALVRTDDAERQERALDQVAIEVIDHIERENSRRSRQGALGGMPSGLRRFQGDELDLETRWLITDFGRECVAIVEDARSRATDLNG